MLLEDQDRSRWNLARIDEGLRVLERAVSLRRPGPYQLQAAIAAARTPKGAPWAEIVALYDRLVGARPSPIVRLNRAVAVALAGDVDEGLALMDELEGLEGYHLLHAARADLLRRLDRRRGGGCARTGARCELTANEPETRYLERRLAEVS